MVKRDIVDSARAARRKAERHRLGTLHNLVLSRATLERYLQRVTEFFEWLDEEAIELPSDCFALDEILQRYLEELWGSGQPRADAANVLCGLQHLLPAIKKHIPASWRLYGAWQSREEPARAGGQNKH